MRKLRHGDLALPEIGQLWSKDGGVQAEALSGSACGSCILMIDLLCLQPLLKWLSQRSVCFLTYPPFFHLYIFRTCARTRCVSGSRLLIHFFVVWCVDSLFVHSKSTFERNSYICLSQFGIFLWCNITLRFSRPHWLRVATEQLRHGSSELRGCSKLHNTYPISHLLWKKECKISHE